MNVIYGLLVLLLLVAMFAATYNWARWMDTSDELLAARSDYDRVWDERQQAVYERDSWKRAWEDANDRLEEMRVLYVDTEEKWEEADAKLGEVRQELGRTITALAREQAAKQHGISVGIPYQPADDEGWPGVEESAARVEAADRIIEAFGKYPKYEATSMFEGYSDRNVL